MDTPNQEVKLAKLLLEGKNCDSCADYQCSSRRFEDDYVCIGYIEERNYSIEEMFGAFKVFDEVYKKIWKK